MNVGVLMLNKIKLNKGAVILDFIYVFYHTKISILEL